MNRYDLMTAESLKYKEDYGQILDEVKEYYDTTYEGKISLTDEDVYAIGKYTKTVETYAPFMEASMGNNPTGLGNLGDALRSNLGLTATQYATSIVPLLTSVQPTDQEIAIIYYKQTIATAERGGVAKGDELMSRFGKVNEKMDDYIRDEQFKNDVEWVEANNAAGFTIQLQGPIRPGTININLAGKVRAIDNGEGNIFGAYIDPSKSSINYDSGELKIALIGHTSLGLVDNTDKFEVAYTQLVFNSDSIAGFRYNISSEPLPVQYYPLQTTYDTVNDFVTKRQFGTAISDFANKDLIYQINKSLAGGLIKKFKAAALRNEAATGNQLTWSLTPPAGTSLLEHRRTFTDIYELAISGMEARAGLGGVSGVIVGAEGRRIYNALGIGHTKSKPGAYVIGFDGEIVIIYASEEFIGKDEVLLVHKGDFFETAAVYAPFLPVMNVTTQGRYDNVFQKTTGAATGAGMKVVNEGFVQRIKLVP